MARVLNDIPLAVCIYDMDGMSTNTDKDTREAEKQRARLGLFSQNVWDTALECYALRNELKKLKSKKIIKVISGMSIYLKNLGMKIKHLG